MITTDSLLAGYGLSLAGGWIAAGLFLLIARRGKDAAKSGKLVSASLVGLVERAFFTTAILFDLSGVVIAMIAWIGAKLGANWGARRGEDIIYLRVTALVAGLISMFFAMVGGLVSAGRIPI